MPIYVSTAMGLIQAISDANEDLGNVYEIELQADIGLSSQVDTLFGPVGTPVVRGQVVINGAGAGYKIERTSGTIRLFSVNAKSGAPNASLTLRNLHLHNGDAGGSAGSGLAVNDGRLVLENCTVSNCKGLGNGGAIYNGDGCHLKINNCVFIQNQATGANGRGGAIYNSSGSTLEADDTIFIYNSLLGAGGRGGAIYQWSGGSDIYLYDCSFVQNIADAGENIYTDRTLSLVAVRSWWGNVTGPNGLDGVSGYNIITQPYRPTLPHFSPIPGTPTNPCLPPASAYTIQITASSPGANVRRGPSADDACITTFDSAPYCNDLAAPLATYPLRAYATDEQSFMWYGFEHSARPNYLSWVRQDVASVTPSPPFSGVPDFETQLDNTWGDILQISGDVLDRDFGSNRFRGFGNGIGLQAVYAAIADCSHPGLDFFPVTSGNVKAKAVADGIVVGIGLSGDGRRATGWGAVPNGGCNLIIRTGGHFVLYGELESVEPHLYLGARVFTGEIIATLANLGGNTHLHLEVDAYSGGQTTGCQLRQKFGAIIHEAGTENPAFLIDPMYYVSNKGSFVSTIGPIDNSSCANTLKTNYNLSSYDGASINAKSFDYEVRTDTYLQGFHRDNGTIHNPTTCVTAQPGACP